MAHGSCCSLVRERSLFAAVGVQLFIPLFNSPRSCEKPTVTGKFFCDFYYPTTTLPKNKVHEGKTVEICTVK